LVKFSKVWLRTNLEVHLFEGKEEVEKKPKPGEVVTGKQNVSFIFFFF
jgi:hypothetical protein